MYFVIWCEFRFHFTERIFWFLCLLLSIFGSYHLIRQSLIDFEESSNSMVVESLQRDDRTYFPSIGVCEIGHLKEVYTGLEQTVDKLVPLANSFVSDPCWRYTVFHLYSICISQSYSRTAGVIVPANNIYKSIVTYLQFYELHLRPT